MTLEKERNAIHEVLMPIKELKEILEVSVARYGWALVLDELFNIAIKQDEKSLTPEQKDAILDFVPSLLEMGVR